LYDINCALVGYNNKLKNQGFEVDKTAKIPKSQYNRMLLDSPVVLQHCMFLNNACCCCC
jgi:hypothetical protein